MAVTPAREPVPEPTSRSAGAWPWVVVLVVAITGLAATLLTGRQAEDEKRDHERNVAVQAAVLVDGTTESSVAAVAGAGGIVTPEGAVELDTFRSYSREVVAISPINVLAFEPVITPDERAAFEQRSRREDEKSCSRP